MANGIDWFRWHHGTVTDQKFRIVAKRAGSSVAEVIAVWACLLETASASDSRGDSGVPDFEAIDCALGMDDGKAMSIYAAMRARELIASDSGQIAAWDKRQPKREDDTANDRKRRQRERDHEMKLEESVTGGESHTVTHGHDESHTVTHGHARGEESREEEKEKTKTARKRAAPAVLVSLSDLIAEGVDPQHAADWLVNRKGKELPLTPTAWDQTKAEAVKAGLSVPEAIKAAAGNGWAGFKAAWLQPDAQHGRPQPAATVPSNDAVRTAAMLRQQSERAPDKPPPEVLAALRLATKRMTA